MYLFDETKKRLKLSHQNKFLKPGLVKKNQSENCIFVKDKHSTTGS